MKNYPIVISGASGGIGRATVERLHADGWSVLGLDRSSPVNSSRFLDFYEVDLTNTSAVSLICEKIIRTHPKLWALIHCAGIYPIKPFLEYSLELWDEVHAVNVRSAFQMAKHLSNAIVDGGRIVLVASGAAHLGSHDVGYSASKAGLIGLMKGLALNFASRGILVNSVCPGPIDTPMSRRMSADSVSNYKERIPLGRFGSPNEVAVVIEFLIAPENAYVNGATIDVTGGFYMR